ncbi:MAG: glycoside hydrolase family 3 C-terminal domain-containing protein [Treponemataceae bacterium]|nr:glycoside hydrolase family 3 C-terminal domain-containing protein [Treponemataceae bacterium]
MNTVAKEIALDSIVLLQNIGQLLPLPAGCSVSIFGRAQVVPYYSGNGSGAARGGEPPVTPLDAACRTRGLSVCNELAAFYRDAAEKEAASKPPMDFSAFKEMVNSGLMYEIFGKYTPPEVEYTVPAELYRKAREHSDTAILFIGRNSGGEECDRHLEDDYYLIPSEKALIEQVCTTFEKVIIVLNLNGTIDLEWTEKYPSIRSILFMGLPGEGGGEAVIDLITGAVSPSGKLSFTIARKYEEYASAKHFSFDKENDRILTYADYGLEEPPAAGDFARRPVTVYQEGVFNGYRWFDAHSIKPLFPFGHGLSYTTFHLEQGKPSDPALRHADFCVKVSNTGARSGKCTVLVYASPAEAEERGDPRKVLVGFGKTRELQPCESDIIGITIDKKDMAVYHEDSSTFELEADNYNFLVGDDSCHLVEWRTLMYKEGEILCECQDDDTPVAIPDESYIPESIRKTVAGLSDEELAALCVGWGPGVPFAAITGSDYPDTIDGPDGKPVTVNSHPAGVRGYVSPAIPEKGIYSQLYQDGPAGVGQTVWPTEMIAACSFNRELLKAFGEAVAEECEKARINVWLAPALNLHRNPLCGRNFEYYSEDPVLAGELAVAMALGAQKSGTVLVCPKHFAANEQETYRRGSSRRHYDAVDSIISERALREVYLKPFEKIVRSGAVHCIMSSFNKINGTFAGGNSWLLTQVLRNEWGFKGIVVTDWGDMDIVVDGADGVAAGNDIIMPGGVPVIKQILAGLKEGRVTRNQLEQAVCRLLYTVELTLSK